MTVVTACAAYSLKREAVCTSETSVNYQITQHRILENSTPQFWKKKPRAGFDVLSAGAGQINPVEAHRVVRRRGSHTLQTIGSQMAVRLSELRVGRALPPQEDSWYSFLLESRHQSHSVMEQLGQQKNPMTPHQELNPRPSNF
jgi:hypothetical protein